MVAVSRLEVPGPPSAQVWGTFGLSVLLHLCLLAAAVMVPRFQVGRYITVPVTYTVNLVSAAPGGRPAAPAKAAAAPASPSPPAAAPPAPPVTAPRPAPRPTEELTLPGRRPAKTAPTKEEPTLLPPSLTGRQKTPPPRPVPAPPAPVAPVPVPQAPPAAAPPAPPAAVASVAPSRAPAKGSGVEVAGPGAGDGGGTVLAQYLTLIDWKIQGNWVPAAAGGQSEAVVVIRFRVLRTGQVKDLGLETSSGNASVDNAAMRAIRQSLPFPPFPNLLTEPLLDLRYRFVMERG